MSHLKDQSTHGLWDVSDTPPSARPNAKVNCINTDEAAIVPAGTTFGFLEYAKPIKGETTSESSKRSWTAAFPDELRQALKACSIFPLMTIYWVAYSQMTTNLISQASQMDLPSWLTNDLINIIDVCTANQAHPPCHPDSHL
jgi:POT family